MIINMINSALQTLKESIIKSSKAAKIYIYLQFS